MYSINENSRISPGIPGLRHQLSEALGLENILGTNSLIPLVTTDYYWLQAVIMEKCGIIAKIRLVYVYIYKIKLVHFKILVSCNNSHGTLKTLVILIQIEFKENNIKKST